MKYKNTLLAVKDIDRSAEFYRKVLGLRVVADFGANKTLTGGLCLQTLDRWENFIEQREVSFGGNSCEVYFEEDDFDGFAQKLQKLDIKYVHPVKEHRWGQRVVRIYDLDGHIIEIGEEIKTVCRRFAGQGMTAAQVARRMDVPTSFVEKCLKDR